MRQQFWPGVKYSCTKCQCKPWPTSVVPGSAAFHNSCPAAPQRAPWQRSRAAPAMRQAGTWGMIPRCASQSEPAMDARRTATSLMGGRASGSWYQHSL